MQRMQQHNPMADMMQYQLDASIQLADAMFSSTEKIDKAMLGVTHQTVDRQLKLARAVTDLRDPSKLSEIQSVLSARPENAMHCQQEILAAMTEMQAEIGKSIRNYMERFSLATNEKLSEMSRQLNAAGKNGEAGNHNPFSGMMSLWNQAFQEASRIASQNMMAARSGVETAVHAARDAVVHAAEAGAESAEELHDEGHTESHRRHTSKRK